MVGSIPAFERDRRANLEGRGATLLTASGALVALVTGLAAFVVGKDRLFVDHTAVIELCMALPWFVLIGGDRARGPDGWEYSVIGRESLKKIAGTDEVWNRSANLAVRDDVDQQVKTICTLRDGNNEMAVWILVSLAFEIVAIVLLSVAVGFELCARL